MTITSLFRRLIIPAACLAQLCLGGCAVIDQKIGLNYASPEQALVKHTGDITVIRVDPKDASKNSRGEWIIGSLNNANGVHQADLLADRSTAEWISDALLLELRQAGYTANYADSLSATTAHALAITDIHVVLALDKGVVSTDTRQELKFNVEVFRNSDKLKTFSVAARDNRTLPFNASQADQEAIMLKSLQDAMRQIVPDIMALIDKK